MAILVTGGTGFIGREVVKELAKRGEEVIIIGRHEPRGELTEIARFVKGDISVREHVENVFKEYHPEGVIHLAAMLSLMCESDPWTCHKVNFTGTYNILEAARIFNVEKIAYASSLASMIHPDSSPVITDIDIQRPRLLYGISKVYGELMGLYYNHKFGIDFRAVRYPEVIGPGVKHPGIAQCIPWAIEHALRGEPYSLWLPENAKVPIMYYKDAARAIVDLYYAPEERIRIRTYNVVGLEVIVKDFVNELKELIPGAKIDIQPDPEILRALGDVKIERVDDSGARKEWGWKPKYKTIKDIIEAFRMELDKKGTTGTYMGKFEKERASIFQPNKDYSSLEFKRAPTGGMDTGTTEQIPSAFKEALNDPKQIATLVWYGVFGWKERTGVKGNALKMARLLFEREKEAVRHMDPRNLKTMMAQVIVGKLGTRFAQFGVEAILHDLSWLKTWFYNEPLPPCIRTALENGCICQSPWSSEMWYEPERRNCDGRELSAFVSLAYDAVIELIRHMGGDTNVVPEEARRRAEAVREGLRRECFGGGQDSG
ncbi:SDR family NAD(P)-dependent oxidoreductase [Thermococcus sp. 9N3]|uniref:SDR family NAD(P)-dependent oxidoreductase n=1 Tax=Thermococcus sp. 9N3 TaxID=163002 RepID=UPI001430C1D6|nr:SDR family NAD(P)-dependent oxidoreductase [Thermococcus sp. 9N3]NJE48879.1 SDR family NAD(P)-dependent oxidoreductase [Thermococcus sp. 9N3]